MPERAQRRDVLGFFDQAFDWFFYAFVFITIFLPSGTLYGINFKYPLYLGLLPLAVYSVFRRHQARSMDIALAIGVPVIVSAWLILGLSNGFGVAGAVRQYADILLTLLLCWLASIYCGREESRRLDFCRLVLKGVFAAAFLKIGVIAYALVRGIPVVEMVLWLNKIFSAELMTMDLGSLFGRVQFVSDELIPICIFIVLRHRDRLKIGYVYASLTIILLLVSVLFSFSRYFWGFTIFAFLLGLMLGKRDRFQFVLILVVSLSFLAALPVLVTLYQLRFSTTVTGESDQQRFNQVPSLQRFFVEAPIFGHGLGSYTTENIRGTTEAGRAGYEVQLLAIPAQVGLVGTGFFIALGFYFYKGLWWKSPLAFADRVGIAMLLLFWIAAGLTNPLLFHPLAGVNYATLAALSGMKTRREWRTPDRRLPGKRKVAE